MPRTVVINPKSRKIYFTPKKTGNIVLELQAVGLDGNEGLTIVKSDQGAVSGNGVAVWVEANRRCALQVEFSSDFIGAINFSAKSGGIE